MIKITDNAQKLLEKRYLLRDSEGELIEKTWEDICERVAVNIAEAENRDLYQEYADKFYEKLTNMEIIPSSPCLFNADTTSQQLSSCFVLDIEDNIEGIFQTVAECAKIFQMSGGAGFSMRKIRPRGAECKSSGSTASGVVSFMHVFDTVVERVRQGNKRNGALKIDLPCNHPEIFDFIHCKDDTSQLTNMNISVSVTKEFMEAVENDSMWDLKFGGKIYQKVSAKALYEEILQSAWQTGEPSLSFQTEMDNGNMNPHLSREVFSNPCCEFVNLPYSSCNLASINLMKVIHNGEVDWKKLRTNVEVTFRFLDDMITVNHLPLDKIDEMTKKIRPIGMGTMGFADMLYSLKIPYDSEECLKFVDTLYSFIQSTALNYNINLAFERGTYPAYQGSMWERRNLPVRCSSMTSIAPNGSIAFIANTTGGIEPQYALVYIRTDNEGVRYYIVDAVFEEYLVQHGLFTDEILQMITNNKGSIQGLNSHFSKVIQRIFVTASDISPEWHVRVLAKIQEYVCLSISKTVNLPKEATVEDIGNIYMLASKLGVKGVSVYRDGSRPDQVLTTGNPVEELEAELKWGDTKQAPIESADSRTVKISTGCGSMYLTMTKDEEGNIDQTFINKGSKGTCFAYQNALSRLTSLALRTGADVEKIADQLLSIPVCPSYYGRKCAGKYVSKGSSCPSAIAYKLLEYSNIGMPKQSEINVEDLRVVETHTISCPECGNSLHRTGGCISCVSCGYSKCE